MQSCDFACEGKTKSRAGDLGEAIDPVLTLLGREDEVPLVELEQYDLDNVVLRGVPAILRRRDTEQDDFVRGITLRALKKLESGVG